MSAKFTSIFFNLLFGFLAFVLANVLTFFLIYWLTDRAEAAQRGITETWFWMGLLPVAGFLLTGLVGMIGWFLAGLRSFRRNTGPSTIHLSDWISGAILGLIMGLVTALGFALPVLVFSFSTYWAWPMLFAVVVVFVLTSTVAGYLVGQILRRGNGLEQHQSPS